MLENENVRAEKRGTNEWMSDKSMPEKRAKVEMRADAAAERWRLHLADSCSSTNVRAGRSRHEVQPEIAA